MDRATGLITVELVAYAWYDTRQQLRNLWMVDGLQLADGKGIGNQAATALYALSLSMVGNAPPSENRSGNARTWDPALDMVSASGSQ
jgi:hypothetical protein